MTPEEYLSLKDRLHQAGYSEEIDWCEEVQKPKAPVDFFMEYAWVVLNSGMKNQVAQGIWRRVLDALVKGLPASKVFKHPGKSQAIQDVWGNQELLFQESSAISDDKQVLAWLQALPWIGPVTKYHLAKNLGMDVCKPDRHLVRISAKYGLTPEELCGSLARETGDRIGTVDYVLWRAANLGIIW